MSTKSKNSSTSTELVHIGGVGFIFEVNPNLKYNLISPDVLTFFDGVQESEEVTKKYAFPLTKPNTNISSSLFQCVGYEKIVCFDGTSRMCQRIRCIVEHQRMKCPMFFYLDNSLIRGNVSGIVTQFQSDMLNNKKFLHIAPSNPTAGTLKQALNKSVEIAYIELHLSTGCLPKNLSKEEYKRCKQLELWDFGDGLSYKLFGANLSKYDGIVVWHSKDVESMLLFGLITSAYNGSIFHIDVSKLYGNCLCAELAPEQLFSCLNSAIKVSSRKKQVLKHKYEDLPHEYPCIKRYVNHKFGVIEKDVVKKRLLRYVTNKPQSWRIPSSYAMVKSRIGERYFSMFWDCLTLELLSEGRAVISEMLFEPQSGCEYPLGSCMTTPYLYNGFDLRKLYSFKYFKVKSLVSTKKS